MLRTCAVRWERRLRGACLLTIWSLTLPGCDGADGLGGSALVPEPDVDVVDRPPEPPTPLPVDPDPEPSPSPDPDPSPEPPRPNIIFVIADDVGYGDLGSFYQDRRSAEGFARAFDTPSLDAMADEGMRLAHHYASAPVCAPARGSLFQGKHQGHANVRDNDFDKGLADDVTIATLLREAGYFTAHIGKYGLYGGGTAAPNDRGFDQFFGYRNHNDGHEHYPGSTGVAFDENGTLISDINPDVYTTDAFTAAAKKTIVERVEANPEAPFFIYLAYDTPHFPLQFPPAPYPDGRGKEGGLQWRPGPAFSNTSFDDETRIESYQHPDLDPDWTTNARKHVSMMLRLDNAMEDIMQTLRDVGVAENTLVVFTSDNGPHNERGHDPQYFRSYGDLDGIKRDLWEGGIRVPTLAWWPGGIAAGSVSSFPSSFADWMATFAELSGVPIPAVTDGVSLASVLTGDEPPKDDRYLYFEYLTPSYATRTPSYSDFGSKGGQRRGQMQAIRIGDYKGIRYNIDPENPETTPFQIYDVVNDSGEQTDLSDQMPALQHVMSQTVLRARRDGDYLRPYSDAHVPDVRDLQTEAGLQYRSFEGEYPWVPDFSVLPEKASGIADTLDASVRPRAEHFGLAFSGYIRVPVGGDYTFYLTSDGPAHLWIHDAHVVHNGIYDLSDEKSGRIRLLPGYHPITVYYVHGAGENHTLGVAYEGPETPKQPLPRASLVHAVGQGSTTTVVAVDDRLVAESGASGEPSSSAVINVLDNDFSVEGRAVTFEQVVEPPDHGEVTVTNGTLTYLPDAGYRGYDYLSYMVSDGESTAVGRVVVEVRPGRLTQLHLPFDETSGQEVHHVGGEVVGSIQGFVSDADHWVSVDNRRGLRLNNYGEAGPVDRTSITIDTDMYEAPQSSEARTVTAWIYNARGNAEYLGTILSWGQKANGEKWTLRMETGGHLRLEVEGGFIVGETSIPTQAWTHVAVVLPPGASGVAEALLYINGQLETLGAITNQTVVTSGAEVLIGRSFENGRGFDGILDDLKIFGSALTEAEIREQAGIE